MEEKKYYWKNIIFILIVFAAAFVYYTLRGDGSVSYSLDGAEFVLLGPEDYAAPVDLSALRSAELRDVTDYGSAAGGGSKGNCLYGVWENADFGQYRLCGLRRVSKCIVFTDLDGAVTVCNFESDGTTAEFYSALLDYMRDSGYTVPAA